MCGVKEKKTQMTDALYKQHLRVNGKEWDEMSIEMLFKSSLASEPLAETTVSIQFLKRVFLEMWQLDAFYLWQLRCFEVRYWRPLLCYQTRQNCLLGVTLNWRPSISCFVMKEKPRSPILLGFWIAASGNAAHFMTIANWDVPKQHHGHCHKWWMVAPGWQCPPCQHWYK